MASLVVEYTARTVVPLDADAVTDAHVHCARLKPPSSNCGWQPEVDEASGAASGAPESLGLRPPQAKRHVARIARTERCRIFALPKTT
jgi:hypothetical protein